MSYNGPLQSMANPMSTYNMSMQFLREERDGRDSRASDLINERYYSSTSSNHTKTRSPDTPASRALEKELRETHRYFYNSLAANSSFSLRKLFSACFTAQ